jgi:hypothetical protein
MTLWRTDDDCVLPLVKDVRLYILIVIGFFLVYDQYLSMIGN